MNTFLRVVTRLHRTISKVSVEKELSRLYAEDDMVVRSLARAFDAVLKNSVSPQERVWVEKIESLRHRLESSPHEISITDYGAGSRHLALTAEEMYRGRVVTSTTGEVCRRGSKSYRWALLLFKLIRELKPSVCVELGTSLGISAAYQAAALELNRKGKIVSLEGAESLALLAKENLEQLGLARVIVVIGRFQDTLESVLREYAPIEFAFVDGHHVEHATLAYFEQIFPSLSENAVLVFDDIAWSEGMKRAWSTIMEDKRVGVCVDLVTVGICIPARSPGEKRTWKIALG